MKDYDPAVPLYSLHIPKCGGTSLLGALRKWFWRWRVIEHYPQRHNPVLATRAPRGAMCVHGHFNTGRNAGILQLYPQADQFITFLRDPFDRYVSLWHYLARLARERGDEKMLARRADFAAVLHRAARRHKAGRHFGSFVWHFPQLPSAAEIGTQMDRTFVFVGIIERYQDSRDALAAALGKQRMNVPHLNDTSYVASDYESWRPFYRDNFADEYAVYEAALRRNDELLKRYL
jgi:hypothetical protein